MWTFPEALLSKRLLYKCGDGRVTHIALRQLTNIAFEAEDRKEVAAVIDHYSGKDQLPRLQILSLLKDAIWRRGQSGESYSSPNRNRRRQTLHAAETACPAERVYALMGFFDHRIMPDGVETEEQALARLSMANDSDRFAERMISMLPSRISDTACWYSDHDMYGANLWDIEPEVQVAGITASGALVLEGCVAASIRWKGFPKVKNRTKLGLRRTTAHYFSLLSPIIFFIGCAVVKSVRAIGALLLVVGILGLAASPWVIAYAHSGRIRFSEPWFIGVEGVLTAAEVEFHLYGSTPMLGFPPKVTESPTGSIFSTPDTGIRRIGKPAHEQAQEAERRNLRVFTLVDTECNTVYYFTANQAPTVCVFVGREGGLGRYILCSEQCNQNELHKETVIRMPAYLSRRMRSCDWLAVGGLSTASGPSPMRYDAFAAVGRTVRSIAKASVFAQIVNAAPLYRISKRWILPELQSTISLDPVSLITLFLDAPEKELIHRSGDLTVLSCLGLFANPTTAWGEYGTLYPGQGVRYYNPERCLTSTIEVAQVHNYLTRLANGYKDIGIVVDLSLKKKSCSMSFEWVIIRPFVLVGMVFVAAASRDFLGLGALGALLFGQAIVVTKTIIDGNSKIVEDTTKESNIFFLANNVTIIVKSHGELFIHACSSLQYKKIERPVSFEVCSTVLFMAGVLLVGIADLNFKVAYLAGHAIQAILLAFCSSRVLGTQTLNRVNWHVKPVIALKRRRDAYVWATRETSGNTDWLRLWNLANGELLHWIQDQLGHPALVLLPMKN